MKIEAVVGAGRGAVGYLVYSQPGSDAIIVDAPYKTASLYLNAIRKADVNVLYLVTTHGHWDQFADIDSICKATGATLCAHVWDAPRLSDPRMATEDPKERIPTFKGRSADRLLRDGEELQVGDMVFIVMHTPGHTPGSLCLYEANAHALFVGDVMTRQGISRTDFIGGNARNLQESLARIASLPDNTSIFPGHGSPTRLQDERWMLELAKTSNA